MSTFKDRQQLWKMHHAQADFSMVADICQHILTTGLGYEDPVYYSLVVGIYTMYGRPFTESKGVGKLDEAIVPKEHLLLHRELLNHRNKVYAHSDATGPVACFGNINQVRFFSQPRDILPGVVRWRAEPETLKQTIVLCKDLRTKVKYWIDKIQNKHFPHLNLPLGQYVLDLDSTSDRFLIRVPDL